MTTCLGNGQLRTQGFLKRTAKTDQTGRMPRLILVFAGRILSLLVLSCRGSHLVVVLLYVPSGLLCSTLLFENRVSRNQGLGVMLDAIISHEQTKSNRVCCFKTFDAVFRLIFF